MKKWWWWWGKSKTTKAEKGQVLETVGLKWNSRGNETYKCWPYGHGFAWTAEGVVCMYIVICLHSINDMWLISSVLCNCGSGQVPACQCILSYALMPLIERSRLWFPTHITTRNAHLSCGTSGRSFSHPPFSAGNIRPLSHMYYCPPLPIVPLLFVCACKSPCHEFT